MAKISAKQRKKHRRRAINLLVLLFLITGITLSLTVFFEIETVCVEGESIYSSEQVLQIAGIKKGSNMFRFFASRKEQTILNRLAYLEQVKIKRVLPSTVVIEVVPAVAAGTVISGNSNVVFSKTGRVLDVVSERPTDVPVILGVDVGECVVGGELTASETGSMATMLSIAAGLADLGYIDNTSLIDVRDHLELAFVFDNRALVRLGTSSDTAYKLQMFAEIITNRCESDFVGYIDVSSIGRGVCGSNKQILSEQYPEIYSTIG